MESDVDLYIGTIRLRLLKTSHEGKELHGDFAMSVRIFNRQ